ncbi:MAG: hypothetical protein ACRCYY_06135 [Trueperaceae bacterium]
MMKGSRTSKTHHAIAKALHDSNKKRFKPITADETLSFDDLKQEKLCPDCGKALELDLFQKWVCVFCGGWRVNHD